jgi:hypothetical protein
MYEVYTDELFSMIDLDEFIKTEIETKAIVVIDEIDKLVRSVSLTNIFIFSDYRMTVQAQRRLVTKVFSMISYLFSMVPQSMSTKVNQL